MHVGFVCINGANKTMDVMVDELKASLVDVHVP